MIKKVKSATTVRQQGWWLLISWLSFTSCQEGLENRVDPEANQRVEVAVSINLADETGKTGQTGGYGSPSATQTKFSLTADSRQAFSLESCLESPSLQTRSATGSLRPDQLYNLEIQQYDQAGNRIGGMTSAVTQAIGSPLTVSLETNLDCQLVIVAWGVGNTARLGTANLADVRKNTVLPPQAIRDLDPSVQEDMNQMPYVTYLEHVCVTRSGTSGIIGSMSTPDGHDARILLQRLAVRLHLSWTYRVDGYALSQLLVQNVPLNYNVVAAPDGNHTYPSLLDQYTTLQLTAAELQAGSYSCWMPANVKGSNPAATSLAYRTKQNAPRGSSYVDFVAVSTQDAKKKLSYRLYLGGSASSDFNLYANTDYRYSVGFNHTGLPVNDKRVTIIDPIPASENNHNFVPTANSFMVVPGGAFCFDPFVFRQDGVDGENEQLKAWSADAGRGGIASVQLIWQTKENGDTGDPVIGMVNANDDHGNIVEIKRIDGTAPTPDHPASGMGQARIYCRVAPNTTGGNGLIAAFDKAGQILWSWHIWVTDYSPDPEGNETVLSPATKRKQKYTYRSDIDQPPMMDRNLGALAGYTYVPAEELDRSKANGLHYQWGRKDPFPGSYTSEVMNSITISDKVATKGLLNLYAPDGVTFLPRKIQNIKASVEATCRNPTVFYSARPWFVTSGDYWGNASPTTKKTIYDPCPAGWRVAEAKNYYHFFTDRSYAGNKSTSGNSALHAPHTTDTYISSGGVLVYYGQNEESTYFRFTGYHEYQYQFNYVGQMLNIWCRNTLTSSNEATSFCVNWGGLNNYHVANVSWAWSNADAHNTRCIQESTK